MGLIVTGPVPSDTIETDRKSPGPGVDGPLDGAGLADQILGKNISDFKAGNHARLTIHSATPACTRGSERFFPFISKHK